MNNEAESLRAQIRQLKSRLLELEVGQYVEENGLGADERNNIARIIAECKEFYSHQRRLRETHFGYPANLAELSPAVKALIDMDAEGFLANNCGDNAERGNYRMDSKDVENAVIKLFAERFSLKDGYWGYITSGGSESNLCGIGMAFEANPNAILYFSEASHYSIVKHSKHYNSQVIPVKSACDEQIDAKKLCESAILNYENLGKGANIVLTHGTTKYGACDDTGYVSRELRAAGVPFCLHVDAALYGGLPLNQLDAPVIRSLDALSINSVSLSFHKLIGYPKVKSLILAVKKPSGNRISYIGQSDTSVSGSRDILPFSLYEHTREFLTHSKPDMYIKNVRFFEKLLKEGGTPFYRAAQSNIFVIDKPSDDLCKTYQLSTFNDKNGAAKAHIVIFPSHTAGAMQSLAAALKK